jgi:hypothetical protein
VSSCPVAEKVIPFGQFFLLRNFIERSISFSGVNRNMLGINRFALQNACIAIAPRAVGSTFRVAETYDPNLQRAGVVMPPQVVFQREMIALGLTWLFSLFTNVALRPLARRYKLSKQLVILLTAAIGTAIAEYVGRNIAYKQIQPIKTQCIANATVSRPEVQSQSGLNPYLLLQTIFQTGRPGVPPVYQNNVTAAPVMSPLVSQNPGIDAEH